MEYVTLGKTGLRVSRLGLGGIPIQRGGREQAKALLDAVHAAGINYIDTARLYTTSEALIGEAIQGRRQDFVLATKAKVVDGAAMAASIEESLTNLRTDYIDLYQIHNPEMEEYERIIAPGGALEAMQEAKAAGKIGHLGITAHSAEVLLRALEEPWVETVMFPFNLVENHGAAVLKKCREKGVAFIAMKPLAGGAIDDASLALRFIAAERDVTVVIPGMFGAEEVAQNCAAMEDTAPLTAEEHEKMEQLRRELGNVFCRRCGYCAPCTAGIDIPRCFIFHGYLKRYHMPDFGRHSYEGLKVHASACVGCGACESRCPYHLPIREMLKEVAADFGN